MKSLFAPHVCDIYKVGHAPLFPNDTTFIYSNFTARSDRLFLDSKSCSVAWDSKVTWVGLQGVLQEITDLWNDTFFNQPKAEVLQRYKRRMDTMVGAERIPLKHLAALHDLGYLPISVLALPEGSRVNIGIPLYTIYNTHEDFFWVTNYLETVISALLWKVVTNATIAGQYRRVLDDWATATGVPRDFVSIQGHDFCFRGMSGIEDAARSQFGHLVYFAGTDTIPSVDYAEHYYQADADKEFLACSVTATEHAVATANILSRQSNQLLDLRRDRIEVTPKVATEQRLLAEEGFIREVISEKVPTGVVALVCDSFDFWGVVGDVLPRLKDVILAREQDSLGLAKVVIRPDSGDPVEVICGAEIFEFGDSDEDRRRFSGWLADKRARRTPVIYYRDSGVLYRGVDSVRGPKTKTWSELINELAEKGCTNEQVSDFLFMASPLKLVDSHSWPDRIDDGYGPKFAQQVAVCEEFLSSYGIETTPVQTGQFSHGYRITEHTLSVEELGAVEALWNTFGGTTNALGFRELESHIGLIYGDSITVHRAQEILRRLAAKGFASSNVVFGIGSYTYQHNTRDTFGMAIKATATEVNGSVIDLFKAPATEGETSKKSAKGFLRVDLVDGNYVLAQEQVIAPADLPHLSGELKQVYVDGEFTRTVTFSEIRARLASA